VASAIVSKLGDLGINQVAGRGYGAYLLVGALVALGSDLRGGLIREARKDHGFMELVEGDLDRTRPLCIVDDLLSGGSSTVQAASLLRQEGYQPTHLMVVFKFGWNAGAAKVRRFGIEPMWLATLDR
jgi:orotate phosphoribosyltransferase